MASDLNYLYNVRILLNNYYSIKKQNEGVTNEMIRQTNVIKREANNKIATIKKQIKKWYKSKTTFSRILLFLIIAVILFVGLYCKYDFFNLSLMDYIERCQDLVDNDRSYLLSHGNFAARYTGALVGNSLLVLFMGIYLLFGMLHVIYCGENEKLEDKLTDILGRVVASIFIILLVYLVL